MSLIVEFSSNQCHVLKSIINKRYKWKKRETIEYTILIHSLDSLSLDKWKFRYFLDVHIISLCNSENYLVNKVLVSMYGSFIFGLLWGQSLVKFFLELLAEISWEFPLMLQSLFYHFDGPFFFLHYELKVDYFFRQLFWSLACQICNPRLNC